MNGLTWNLRKLSFQNEASHLVNQTQHQEIQGGQHIYIRERFPRPTSTRESRCVSVPFETVPTFTERPYLSEELDEKVGKTHRIGLAHAVAVVGLGGTGKTQLVLRYIEEHEKDYNTVLWIDVRSKETTRSSYERCCRMLGLSVEANTGDVPIHDISAVQAVLSWLQSRDEDKRWLAVVDNADDLSWDVSSIMPKGKAGTVIVTSEDAQASRLLGGRTPTVKVDAMEPEEAVRLVLNYFDESVCRDGACCMLVKEITQCLDQLALGLDLAGARVRADIENGNDVAAALRQYLADYRRNQDKLLRDDEFACISIYKKTVWTAWETSLASLRKIEDSQSDIYPIQLLSFVTLLDRANVQDELFRLASLGLEEACVRLNVEVPTWIQGLLGRGEDDQWDDFSYRSSMRLLLRYGLVRPVGMPWKGVTMHSLAQWRASVGTNREQYWRLYLVFMAAVCVNVGKEADRVGFRRYVVVHLPPNDSLLDRTGDVEEKGLWWMWSCVGQVLWGEGRSKEAEGLFLKVMEARRGALGKEHPDTLDAMGSLASTYRKQGRWKEAEVLEIKVVEARRRVLGEEHPDTLTAMANLAATYRKQGRWKEAEELFLKVMEARSRVLGEEHPDTLRATGSLAATSRKQGRSKEAEVLEVKVMKTRSRVLGEEHPDTLRAMGSLAATHRKQGRSKEAEGLEVKVMVVSRRVLGQEHPDTLTATANLAATYRKQRRWREAEELFIMVLEARRRVLGEEHPDTLTAMANLAATYRKQGRWKEAEELFLEVVEARRKVLGEEHPDMLKAMDSLALTYRDLGQDAVAIDLMKRSAVASSRVLGYDHPDCKSRYEQASLWSSVTTNDDRDGDQDIGQPADSDEDGGVTVW